MKFKRIKFYNYRCFRNAEIEFTTLPQEKRNICLISGSNGNGKTELQLAFQYVLYGFDFNKVTGGEQTPYSLNQTEYLNLKKRRNADATCYVELEFDSLDKNYVVTRTDLYKNTHNNVEHKQQDISLKIKLSDGRTLPIITNREEVEEQLNKIVPPKILNAVMICDGERVQKFSDSENNANFAIQSIIRKMTEIEKLEILKLNIEKSIGILNEKISIDESIRNTRLPKLYKEKAKDQNDLKNCTDELNSANKRINELINKKNAIKASYETAKEYAEIRNKHQEKVNEKKILENQKKIILSNVFDLIADDGYLGLTDYLYDTSSKLLDATKPKYVGITGSDIDSILKETSCICGTHIDERIKKILLDLKEKLPPHNHAAILLHAIEILKEGRKNSKNKALKSGEQLVGIVSDIDKIDIDIKRILTNSQQHRMIDYDKILKETNEIEYELLKLNQRISNLKQFSISLENRIYKANEKIDSLSKQMETSDVYSKKFKFLERINQLIFKINEFREIESIENINAYLKKSFIQLRTNEDHNRMIKIVRETDGTTSAFKLITYDQAAYTETDINDPIPQEYHLSSSPGELKLTSLAFMKAMLDFVKDNAIQNKSLDEDQRETYPFVVDAPFGDIMEENLQRAIKLLPEYSDQIILMLALKPENIPQELKPYISSTYILDKIDVEGDVFSHSVAKKIN